MLPGRTVHKEPACSMTDSTASMKQPARNKPDLIANIVPQTMDAHPQHVQLLQSPKSTGGQENTYKFTYCTLIVYQHRAENDDH